MGTETSYQSPIELLYHHQEVKLNNPLMGTETDIESAVNMYGTKIAC